MNQRVTPKTVCKWPIGTFTTSTEVALDEMNRKARQVIADAARKRKLAKRPRIGSKHEAGRLVVSPKHGVFQATMPALDDDAVWLQHLLRGDAAGLRDTLLSIKNRWTA